MYAPWAFLFFLCGVAASAFVSHDPLWVVTLLAVCLGCFFGVQSRRFSILMAAALGFAVGVFRAKGGPIHVPLDAVRDMLEAARDSFVAHLSRALPEPHASYLAGILVGARSSIPWDLRQAFRVTGTSHLVALSGYNVTVIAEYLRSLSTRAWFPMSGIVLFALGTGASSSVVRASIMAIVLLAVRGAGHEYSIRRSLLLAIFLMVFFDPEILLGDIGFQLSVAATIGIAELAPIVERRARVIPATFHIRESFATTIAAQAATAPLILWYFGSVSLIAPVVNVLVLPTMPLVMMFGSIAGIASFTGSAGQILSWPAYMLLEYQIAIIQFFAGVVHGV